MKSPFDPTPTNDAKLIVALPTDLKRRVFEHATARGIPASLFVRQAIAAATQTAKAA